MQKHLRHFTQSLWGKDNLNRYVFSLDLKYESVRDDVTSVGRLVHVLAAAMGNARLLMVRRLVRGTYERTSYAYKAYYIPLRNSRTGKSPCHNKTSAFNFCATDVELHALRVSSNERQVVRPFRRRRLFDGRNVVEWRWLWTRHEICCWTRSYL